MTGLEIAGAILGVVVACGTIIGGVVYGVQWIARTTTADIVAALGKVQDEVANIGTQVAKLWEKSDAGEKTHAEQAKDLAVLTERVDAIAPKPKRAKRR